MLKYIKHTLLSAILLAVSCGLFAQRAEMSKYLKQLDSVKLRTILSTLASDEFEGRGTGAQGGEIAQEYIAACMDSCGIRQGNNGSYFQNIKSIKSFNAARRRFTVNNVDFPNDYKYENFYSQDTVLKIKEIIFVAANGSADDPVLNNIENKVIMMSNRTLPDYLADQNPKTFISIIPAFEPASMSEKVHFTPPQSKDK
ncbi:MAG: hypothetical protein LBH60_05830, partial [Prevotellaceae bacterium]|nr:hypothetical protein [Prevotellaceae bacterium]